MVGRMSLSRRHWQKAVDSVASGLRSNTEKAESSWVELVTSQTRVTYIHARINAR